MGNNGIFKNTVRSPRQTSIELDFTGGMKFTNATLDENVHKTLLNFDISSDTTAITPRAAICNYENIDIDLANFTAPTKQTDLSLVHIQEIETEDNATPMLIYTGAGVGSVPNLTIAKGNSTYHSEGSGPKLIHFSEQNMHDMVTPTPSPLFKSLGVKGFNSNYYFLEDSATNILSYIDIAKLHDTADITPEIITPKVVDPTEAVTYGYNMLLEEPYNFIDGSTAGNIMLLGVMPHEYDADTSECGDLLINPKMNKPMCFRVYYKAETDAKYEIIWEAKDADNDTYAEIQKDMVTITAARPKVFAPVSVPSDAYMLRVSFFREIADTPGTYEDVTEAAITSGFNFDVEDPTSIANLEMKEYDLDKCEGIAFWKNKLVLYRCADDAHILFVSYANDPSYFPYPNNVDVFDEAIVHVMPFLDALLVFTTSQIWQLTMNPTGTGWIKKLIQTHLRITSFDTQFIQVVKNMVFFKSGNYFYMIVPKVSSTTGELTLAPISRPMTSFFDTFENNITDLLQELYLLPVTSTFEMQTVTNYLDYDDVHNVYTLTSDTMDNYVNVDIIYNTVTRYWRMHCYESDAILSPALADATRPGNLVSIVTIDDTQR
ncbi:MAG: hypothetical protein GX787_06155, partial [Tissierellia bacterium]|nr:hypothetical protein [Tissierellia bacterium]